MRRAGIDQRLHVRECVEQEMRADLRLQQMQTRVERLPLELAALERERELLTASEGFLLTDDRCERGPWRDQEAGVRKDQPSDQALAHRPERRRTSGSG